MSGSLPYFKVYPGDWRKHIGAQSLSYHARGIWFELRCIMNDAPQRGKLVTPDGKALSDDLIARLLGLSLHDSKRAIQEIVDAGVAQLETESGVLYDPEMVTQEHLRVVRSAAGKKGGGNPLFKQPVYTNSKQKRESGFPKEVGSRDSSVPEQEPQPPNPPSPPETADPPGKTDELDLGGESKPKRRTRESAIEEAMAVPLPKKLDVPQFIVKWQGWVRMRFTEHELPRDAKIYAADLLGWLNDYPLDIAVRIVGHALIGRWRSFHLTKEIESELRVVNGKRTPHQEQRENREFKENLKLKRM